MMVSSVGNLRSIPQNDGIAQLTLSIKVFGQGESYTFIFPRTLLFFVELFYFSSRGIQIAPRTENAGEAS